MDWKKLFLSADGRSAQTEFWIGFAILFVAGLILGMVPLIGQVITLLLIYPTVCVFSKRLHDFGKTGWLAALPYAAGVVFAIIAFMVGGAAMLTGLAGGGDEAAAAGALAGAGTIVLLALAMFVFYVGFVLWVGLSKGDPAPNKYGPPPSETVAATV